MNINRSRVDADGIVPNISQQCFPGNRRTGSCHQIGQEFELFRFEGDGFPRDSHGPTIDVDLDRSNLA